MGQLITVKDCISQAGLEIGITQRPVSTVVNSADQDVTQMLALLNVVADEVLLEEPYRTTLGDDNWVADATGRPKKRPTTDTDIILFDGRLAINGLKFRFLKAKGLEFGEEMRDFTTRMAKLAGRANGRVLDLDVDGGRVV
jgi:hypothetical protein